MSRQVQVTIVPKEAGEVIDSILDRIIGEITAPPLDTSGLSMHQLVPHLYNPNYKVRQGKCYQQNSPNLCGYHAIFNTFCFLRLFNGGANEYDLQSGASFWRFKSKVEHFLMAMKRKYKRPDEWPWREQDILFGDFQRTYNQICMEKFEEFAIFRQHQNFYYLSHTWEFQYQNLIGSLESKAELQNKFAQFRGYEGEKPLVLHLMLAITTHWLTFLAIKRGQQVQYWFFDSFNNHYLDFDWQQITAYIEMKNQERIKYKKPALTNFQKESYSMCMKDVQTSLKLIVGCLEGTDDLHAYHYNRQFQIFAEPLEAALSVGAEEASLAVREYKHDISRFFQKQVEWALLYEHNHARMKIIMEASTTLRAHSPEGKFLHSLLHRNSTGFFARAFGRF